MVAFSLLSNMPERGYITNKEASALVGVAPLIEKVEVLKVNA